MKNFLTFELLKILYWTDIDLNRPSDSTVPISKDLAQFQICENKNKKKKGGDQNFQAFGKKKKNGITEGRRRAEQTGGENIGIGGSSDWRTCAVADVPMNAGAGAVGRGLDTTRSLFLLSLSLLVFAKDREKGIKGERGAWAAIPWCNSENAEKRDSNVAGCCCCSSVHA